MPCDWLKRKTPFLFIFWNGPKLYENAVSDQKIGAVTVKARHSCLKPGDRVLVKNLGLRGKRKRADRFECNPYLVKSQPTPTSQSLRSSPRIPVLGKPDCFIGFSYCRSPAFCNRRRSSSSSESVLSVINLPPLVAIPYLSAEDSDGYEARISSCSQPDDDVVLDDTSTKSGSYDGKYVIPVHRKPG